MTLPQADNTSPGYTGFDLETAIGTTLPTTAVRFIRFEINDSYASNGAGYTGIAEIQFFGTVPVPEASSFALAALGSLGLVGVLRWRKK